MANLIINVNVSISVGIYWNILILVHNNVQLVAGGSWFINHYLFMDVFTLTVFVAYVPPSFPVLHCILIPHNVIFQKGNSTMWKAMFLSRCANF